MRTVKRSTQEVDRPLSIATDARLESPPFPNPAFVWWPPVEEVDVEVLNALLAINVVARGTLTERHQQLTLPLVLEMPVAPEERLLLLPGQFRQPIEFSQRQFLVA